MMDWSRLLSPRRLPHAAASEPITAARNPFQKDWDRVVFCSAFRRLQDKTQVHSLPETDYVRTRLTHSMEVSSVGRSLGAAVGETVLQRRAGGLGEISAAEFGHIVSAACLAHDIGNPPFGHFGEATIRHWFGHGQGAALMRPLPAAQAQDFERFEGNAQGFRVLTRLQNWRNAGGLRLTCATLATFMKYPRPAVLGAGAQADPGDCAMKKHGFFVVDRDSFAEVAAEVGLQPRPGGSWCRHPLAYLLEAADDICYRVVDLEDGFKLGRIGFDTAEELLQPLVGGFPPRYREIEEPSQRIAYLRAKAIGRLIEDATAVFLDNEGAILAGSFRDDLIAASAAAPTLREIERLTRERIFQTRARYEVEIGGVEILETLLSAATEAMLQVERGETLSPRSEALMHLLPERPPPGQVGRYEGLLRVTDYVSGMTDSYALATFRRVKGLIRL